MSGTAIALVVAGLVVLAAVFVFTTTARRDRRAALRGVSRETRQRDRSDAALEPIVEGEARTGREIERAAVLARRGAEIEVVEAAPPPAPVAVPDAEAIGVTRRQVLNRGIVGTMGIALAAFGASNIGFLWPPPSKGFGGKINAGKKNDILAAISASKEPYYVAEARSYVVPYPAGALDNAREVYAGAVLAGMEEGVVALYQKCVHLGCRVPWCPSAQWFECPCHGSRYNRVGEKKGGPAPRGLDRFGVAVEGGSVVIDTSVVVQGPDIGTNTTGQEAEGPHCA